nr:PRD domain-containing protein [uncultured Dubosiella sp.]
MPGILRKIRQVAPTLSSDQEVGLFMHIACLIYRLQNDGETPKNVNTKQLILKNKRLYNDLCEILHTAEEEFYIRFQDDDVANMIQMIRMC